MTYPAKNFVPQLDDKALVSVFWQVLNGNNAENVVVDILKRSCTKQRAIDDKRSLIRCRWYDYFTTNWEK